MGSALREILKIIEKKTSYYYLSNTLSEVRLKARALTIGAQIEATNAGSLLAIFLGT